MLQCSWSAGRIVMAQLTEEMSETDEGTWSCRGSDGLAAGGDDGLDGLIVWDGRMAVITLE